jgi:hypothetical protein
MKRWLIVLGIILAVAAIQVLAISVLYARTLPAAEVMGPALAQSPHIYASLSSSNAAAPLAENRAISDTWILIGDSGTHNTDVGLQAISGRAQPSDPCVASQRIYLGFNVNVFGDLDVPKLKLYGFNPNGTNATITVYEVTDDNWPEALPGNAAPTPGAALATATVGGTPVTVTVQSITLTNYVLSNRSPGDNGIASLAIEETSCVDGVATVVFFQDRERSVPSETLPPPNGGPLDVNLASYEAAGSNAKVELKWVTAGESEIEGFAVYRSTSETDGFAQINATLIAAQGNSSSGAGYSLVDDQVENGVTYYYRLEAISTSGETEVLGVVSATPRRAGKTR